MQIERVASSQETNKTGINEPDLLTKQDVEKLCAALVLIINEFLELCYDNEQTTK